jgi:hypothetical protein
MTAHQNRVRAILKSALRRLVGELIHVDHVILCTFLNHDEIWILVLTHSCCNLEKHAWLPSKAYLSKLVAAQRVVYREQPSDQTTPDRTDGQVSITAAGLPGSDLPRSRKRGDPGVDEGRREKDLSWQSPCASRLDGASSLNKKRAMPSRMRAQHRATRLAWLVVLSVLQRHDDLLQVLASIQPGPGHSGHVDGNWGRWPRPHQAHPVPRETSRSM